MCRPCYAHAWHAAHPDYSRQQAKNWRDTHPLYNKECNQKWMLANFDIHRAHVHKRRARKIGNGGSWTATEWQTLKRQYGNRCVSCWNTEIELKALDRKLVPDHIVPLAKAEDGQPKFRRLLSQTGKPVRIQQSVKLCDKDDQHQTEKSLAVLILAQRLDQQIDSWEADADKADGTEELRPCGDTPVSVFFETVFMPWVKSEKEASTIKSYQSYWNAYLKDHFNHSKTLRGYEPFQGTNLLEKLAKEYSENTVAHARALASAIFTYACAKGYITYNPWRDVRKTTTGQDVDDGYAYTQREVEQILDTLEHVSGRETYSAQMAGMAVTLGFYAGLRPSETAGLRWENIDLNKNRITIKQAYVQGDFKGTKTGKIRHVPMLPALAHRIRLWAMVQGHPTKGWLLPNRNGDKPVTMNDRST